MSELQFLKDKIKQIEASIAVSELNNGGQQQSNCNNTTTTGPITRATPTSSQNFNQPPAPSVSPNQRQQQQPQQSNSIATPTPQYNTPLPPIHAWSGSPYGGVSTNTTVSTSVANGQFTLPPLPIANTPYQSFSTPGRMQPPFGSSRASFSMMDENSNSNNKKNNNNNRLSTLSSSAAAIGNVGYNNESGIPPGYGINPNEIINFYEGYAPLRTSFWKVHNFGPLSWVAIILKDSYLGALRSLAESKHVGK
ncbi:unnamed protein product [Ambrosiozyma monospora]|uniref:Unnamed protein product n=1 Tax=Ambrosiozyma monospora TaxID=43982 RepID=A0ACB5UCI1_AMBMO|nr:unnamed protein product [Ambrosiozyma monospora]